MSDEEVILSAAAPGRKITSPWAGFPVETINVPATRMTNVEDVAQCLCVRCKPPRICERETFERQP